MDPQILKEILDVCEGFRLNNRYSARALNQNQTGFINFFQRKYNIPNGQANTVLAAYQQLIITKNNVRITIEDLLSALA